MSTTSRPGRSRIGRGDRGAVARGAVDPHLALGHLVDAVGEFVQRDVQGVARRTPGPLVVAAGIEDLHRPPLHRRGQAGEVGDAVGAQRGTVGEGRDVAGGGTGELVDADPYQLAASLGDLLGGLADQRQRGAPAVEPAQVGDEVVGQLEARASRRGARRRSAVRSRRSTTHSPASIRRRSSAGSTGSGGDRSTGAGPAAVDRAHVRVVGRVGVQPGEQGVDVVLLGHGQRRVDPAPARPRWRSRRWSGWPSRSCRTRGSGRPAVARAARRPAGAPSGTGRGSAPPCPRARPGRCGRWRRRASTRR